MKMNMTPEEKFNRSVLFVFNRIKEQSFLGPEGGDVEYWIHSPPLKDEGMPFPVNEFKIIEKLQERGCVKIKPSKQISATVGNLNKGLKTFTEIIYLEILQPRFDEVHNEFEDKCQDKTEKKIDNKITPISKKPYTKINNDKGYLIISGECIDIGGKESGKFKLVSLLCDPFGIKKSTDLIFENACTGWKRTEAGVLSDRSDHEAKQMKKKLIRSQWREVKRLINEYSKKLSGKKNKLGLELKLKIEKESVWLE